MLGVFLGLVGRSETHTVKLVKINCPWDQLSVYTGWRNKDFLNGEVDKLLLLFSRVIVDYVHWTMNKDNIDYLVFNTNFSSISAILYTVIKDDKTVKFLPKPSTFP
jgi:hypothetical protein